MGKIDQQKFVVSYKPLLFMYLLPRCKCRPDGPIVGPRWVLPVETSRPALCAVRDLKWPHVSVHNFSLSSLLCFGIYCKLTQFLAAFGRHSLPLWCVEDGDTWLSAWNRLLTPRQEGKGFLDWTGCTVNLFISTVGISGCNDGHSLCTDKYFGQFTEQHVEINQILQSFLFAKRSHL